MEPIKAVQDWYVLSERRVATFAKIYQNTRMSLD